MSERIVATRIMGSVELPPRLLADSRGRFIVLPSAESEVGGPIIYEEGGKVFMRVGDGSKSDTIAQLPAGTKIRAGSPTPHTYTDIEVVES